MCTVTWRRAGPSYEIFFNRDEQRSRPSAHPPSVLGAAPRCFIAPIDPRAGGTWLAVNEAGLSVCVLNYYDGQRAPPPPRPCSRGHLVLDQMPLAAAPEVREALARTDLHRYPAFVLLAFDPRTAVCLHWDGRALRSEALTDERRPISTSSFDTDEVLRERRARYDALVGRGDSEPEALLRFHRDTIPRGGAYSVWMERADAWTVSFSRVTVEPGEIRFLYQSRDASPPVVVSCPRHS